jgi:hypothetical protein
MKKITAADLLRLGFEQIDVPAEDNDGIEGYFYFTFNPESKTSYPLLITADEDLKNDAYTVEINELYDAIVIKNLPDLESLVDIIKRNLNNE